MVHGPSLMAKGCRPGPGAQERAPRAQPSPAWASPRGASLALDLEAPSRAAGPGRHPLAMSFSHEP